MCKQSVRNKRENVICCDAEKLPIRDNILDGILSTETIYYLNNPQDFIRNSYNTLKNNSKLIKLFFKCCSY